MGLQLTATKLFLLQCCGVGDLALSATAEQG